MPYFQCLHACFRLSHFIQHILRQQGWWCSMLATPVLVTLITVVTQSVWQMADGGISNYKRSVWCGYSAGPFSIAGWGPVAGGGEAMVMVIYLLVPRDVQRPGSRLQTPLIWPQPPRLPPLTAPHADTGDTGAGDTNTSSGRNPEKSCLSNSTCFWIDAKPSMTISDDVIVLDDEYFVLVSVVNFKWRYVTAQA